MAGLYDSIKKVFQEMNDMSQDEFDQMIKDATQKCDPITCHGECQGQGDCEICIDFRGENQGDRIAELEAENAKLKKHNDAYRWNMKNPLTSEEQLKKELSELREATTWYLECKSAILPFLAECMNLEKWDHADSTRTIVDIDRGRSEEWDATQSKAESAIRALLSKTGEDK